MRHIMVEQQALRVEYTIKHSFTDRIVFGKGEIISPFPFFSALRRPKLAEPLPLFRIMSLQQPLSRVKVNECNVVVVVLDCY